MTIPAPSSPPNPWGRWRDLITDRAVGVTDQAARLGRTHLRGGDTRQGFTDRARDLRDAVERLIGACVEVDHRLSTCDATFVVGGDRLVASCGSAAGHPGDHDADPEPSAARHAYRGAQHLRVLATFVAEGFSLLPWHPTPPGSTGPAVRRQMAEVLEGIGNALDLVIQLAEQTAEAVDAVRRETGLS